MNRNEASNILTSMTTEPERWEDLGQFIKYTGAVTVMKESGVTTLVFGKPVFKDLRKEIEKLQAEKITLTEKVKKYSVQADENIQAREYSKAEAAEKFRKEYARNLENTNLKLSAATESLPEVLKQQILDIDIYLESVQTSVINPVMEERKAMNDRLKEASGKGK